LRQFTLELRKALPLLSNDLGRRVPDEILVVEFGRRLGQFLLEPGESLLQALELRVYVDDPAIGT
jgi:hypothetical protein